jgi:hypothetical protein
MNTIVGALLFLETVVRSIDRQLDTRRPDSKACVFLAVACNQAAGCPPLTGKIMRVKWLPARDAR